MYKAAEITNADLGAVGEEPQAAGDGGRDRLHHEQPQQQVLEPWQDRYNILHLTAVSVLFNHMLC
jgi:hypothetical protein